MGDCNRQLWYGRTAGAAAQPTASSSGQEAAAPAAAPQDSLPLARHITSSADPYWRGLSDLIVQGSISSQDQAQELRTVFSESSMDKWQGRVPAYILSGWCWWLLHHFGLCCSCMLSYRHFTFDGQLQLVDSLTGCVVGLCMPVQQLTA